MGPSGFQTKGFEDRGVGSASLFSSGIALCHVLCSAGILPVALEEYLLDGYRALWSFSVE